MTQRIAYNLRALGSWLFDACFWLAERLDGGWDPPDPERMKLETAGTWTRIQMKKDYPCPRCGGTGGVAVELDDAAVCPTCLGFGVDPQVLSRSEP